MLTPHGNRITVDDNVEQTGPLNRTSAGTSEMSDVRLPPVSLRALDSPSRLHHQLRRCGLIL
jgi:hypothetical protein